MYPALVITGEHGNVIRISKVAHVISIISGSQMKISSGDLSGR